MKKLIFLSSILLFTMNAHAVTLSIDIPNAVAARVQDAFCQRYGYQTTIPDPQDPTGQTMIANPETKNQFIIRMLKGLLRNMTIDVERENADKAQISSSQSQILIP